MWVVGLSRKWSEPLAPFCTRFDERLPFMFAHRTQLREFKMQVGHDWIVARTQYAAHFFETPGTLERAYVLMIPPWLVMERLRYERLIHWPASSKCIGNFTNLLNVVTHFNFQRFKKSNMFPQLCYDYSCSPAQFRSSTEQITGPCIPIIQPEVNKLWSD